MKGRVEEGKSKKGCVRERKYNQGYIELAMEELKDGEAKGVTEGGRKVEGK